MGKRGRVPNWRRFAPLAERADLASGNPFSPFPLPSPDFYQRPLRRTHLHEPESAGMPPAHVASVCRFGMSRYPETFRQRSYKPRNARM